MVNIFKRVDNMALSETKPLLGTNKAQSRPSRTGCRWFKFVTIITLSFAAAAAVVRYTTVSHRENDFNDPSSTLDKNVVIDPEAAYVFGSALPRRDPVQDFVHDYSRPIATRVASVATTNGDYFAKCAPAVTCNPDDVYRTYNGSCNNLRHPSWGASLTPFYRLMDAEFDDGNYTFRIQLDGRPLPSARLIVVKLLSKRDVRHFDRKNNELLVPWGQFLTHDISYYPDDIRNSTTPADLDHCNEKDKSTIPFECETAIPIASDDLVYGPYNVTLFKFVRSTPSVNFSCPLTPRTIMNRNTQYIDASHVYGSNKETADGLRTFINGKLRSQILNNEEYCPLDPNSQFKKSPLGKSFVQFAAGDVNVNQNLAIALFQNVFLRYHNYLADELQILNPFWTDEILYQETRRIMGAVMQIITYDHFLPILLGHEYMEKYGLTGKTSYDPSINSALAQEMASGAFRVFHNIIPAKFYFMAENYSVIDEIEPSKMLQIPDLVIGNVDYMLRGFLETPGRAVQPSYNNLITNVVFKIPNLNAYSGFDLMSYDIQRGRDNGLPPYNKMRELCGLKKARKFADLSDIISAEDIETLKTLYSTVHDIDYIVGALLETPQNGSMVGPSTACVIGDGFYRFKAGDRFFYDVQGQPGSFTAEQLNTLKKISLSHVFCSTSHLNNLQTETFQYVNYKMMPGIKYNCESYRVDFAAWKE